MIELVSIRRKVEAYEKTVKKLKPLDASLAELQERCKNIISHDPKSVRVHRYDSIYDQIEEAIWNVHSDDRTRQTLQDLEPELTKARAAASSARQRKNDLQIQIETATQEGRGEIATAMQLLRCHLKDKIISALSPYTSATTAGQIAEQCDCLKNIDARVSNLAVGTDPVTGFLILEGAAGELKPLEELAT